MPKHTPKGGGTRVRSSVSGQYVPPAQAKLNPRETETERVRKPTPKKQK